MSTLGVFSALGGYHDQWRDGRGEGGSRPPVTIF